MPPKGLLNCRGYSLTLADGTPVTISDEVHLVAPEDVYDRAMDNIFLRPMSFSVRCRIYTRKKRSRDSEAWRRMSLFYPYWNYREKRRYRRWLERKRREAVKARSAL